MSSAGSVTTQLRSCKSVRRPKLAPARIVNSHHIQYLNEKREQEQSTEAVGALFTRPVSTSYLYIPLCHLSCILLSLETEIISISAFSKARYYFTIFQKFQNSLDVILDLLVLQKGCCMRVIAQ